ncbi:hypothetical protein [Burkholderia contaminans]|uniref:hypothetical protein n=1 Tax=Burkholderia contaminans TaxID=488447 RepID=UPI00158296B9|nr:hypothetical protein [Burkholderia contaminans]MEB4656177.1 hypothetical protein [Burkholderia contaminans]MEB4683455.1 hypothetical protein [Burkholderia contaminans]
MSTTSSVAFGRRRHVRMRPMRRDQRALTGAQPRRFAVLDVQLEFGRQHMTSSAIVGG